MTRWSSSRPKSGMKTFEVVSCGCLRNVRLSSRSRKHDCLGWRSLPRCDSNRGFLMPSDRGERASRSNASDADLLMKLIRTELVSIPIEHWGFFFPAQVAVWRFIEAKRPGVLGELKATFRDEPYFH